jgi:hypothetical protein
MNAVRTVLEKGLSSALIMEDDIDWDIRLKSQMPQFAKGVRSITNISESAAQHSPYGDNWDVVWPGHCGDIFPHNDDRRYVIKNDETVAPRAHQPWLQGLRDWPEHTRLIHKAGAPICAFAYAVSRSGAQKLLYALSIKGLTAPFDNALAGLCQDEYMGIKCVSVEPMYFFHHKPAGPLNRDSDIQFGDAGAIREKGYTENIVWSARLNIEQMITRSTNYVLQW